MKCGGDCTALTDGGEPVMQILVLDLWERIEAAEKLGAEARHMFLMMIVCYLVLKEQTFTIK